MAQPPGIVVRIVQGTRERMPALLDRMVTHIQHDVPFYASRDVVGADRLRESLRHNVDYVLSGLLGEDVSDTSAPMATGRERASQGAPLVEMLAAYRLGFAAMWTELVEVAHGLPGDTDGVLVGLAGELLAVHGRYADASVEGYRDEYREKVRLDQREHSALVEAVLAGATSKESLWEVAQALRLPLEGRFLVVVAEAVELGHDPLARAEPALSALDVSSVWRLLPEQTVGVLALRRGSQAASVLDMLAQHAIARIGVSPMFAQLRQASRALQLARLALDHQQPGISVEQFRDSPLSMLVASAPDAAIETARTVLGGLLELRTDDLELLITTFSTWLDAEGSANAAGAALFCHPNTVRYRLRRLEETTGRSLGSPTQLAELVTAVRAWSELPHPD
jgi:hypothetical protein